MGVNWRLVPFTSSATADTHIGASVPCDSGGDAGLGRWPGAARGWGTLVLPSSEGGCKGGLGAAQG